MMWAVMGALALVAYAVHADQRTRATRATGSVVSQCVTTLDRAGLATQSVAPRAVDFRVDHRLYRGVPAGVIASLSAHWGAPVQVRALGGGVVRCEPAPAPAPD